MKIHIKAIEFPNNTLFDIVKLLSFVNTPRLIRESEHSQ
jgi:hypothetical protein